MHAIRHNAATAVYKQQTATMQGIVYMESCRLSLAGACLLTAERKQHRLKSTDKLDLIKLNHRANACASQLVAVCYA